VPIAIRCVCLGERLDRTPDSSFAESEQIAFGTQVLVDGLDSSDDKMRVGCIFSDSDTRSK
jgi:catalase